LKELAPGKVLARIATQFTEEEEDLRGEWYHGEGRFQLGQQSAFLFRLLKPDGVLREIFRNLKNIGLGVLLACNTIYGVPIVSPSLLAVVTDRGADRC
jgi:hypothetical protein